MPHYMVVSGEMEIGGDEYDPPEYGCCVVYEDAANRRESIKAALKSREFVKWVRDARGNGENPFIGVKAELMVPCEHGACGCGLCPDCPECLAKWEREVELELAAENGHLIDGIPASELLNMVCAHFAFGPVALGFGGFMKGES